MTPVSPTSSPPPPSVPTAPSAPATPGAPSTSATPRPEYPRPQFVRPDWLCLNGEWQFEVDQGDSGLERGLVHQDLAARIVVPFAPESIASGIGNTDFLEAVWYRREVAIPAGWAGRRVLLHVGAADYDTTVWVDGVEVGRHRGGFTSFSVDLGEAAVPGRTLTLVLRVRDSQHQVQARGKQSTWLANSHCNYTRTSGIWQTIWLEPVPETRIRRLKITPQLAAAQFVVEVPLSANREGSQVRVVVSDENGEVAAVAQAADVDLAPTLTLALPADRVRVWRPEDPHLYDVRVELSDAGGALLDAVDSYTGLRSVAIDGNALLLNGEPVFQRLVLDQGYWPDTLMTAPSDAALVADIRLGLEAGFNGARLHQKVFEERYLYHADRLGYLVWGEYGDWGVSGQGPDGENQRPPASFVAEWIEAVTRDVNHPSIVGWCPLNETHQRLHDRITVLDEVTQAMFWATKLADPHRPVIDASGYAHRVAETDVYDSHSYEQDPEVFRRQQEGLAKGEPYVNARESGAAMSLPYGGQPYFVSEFGGIWWDPSALVGDGADRSESWGYGQRVSDAEEFYQRFEGLVRVLADDPRMFGYCYTQLTDVFQERNGIYEFDRGVKFDLDRLRRIQAGPAAYERLPFGQERRRSGRWGDGGDTA